MYRVRERCPYCDGPVTKASSCPDEINVCCEKCDETWHDWDDWEDMCQRFYDAKAERELERKGW